MNPHNNPNVLSLESVDSAESWRELSALIKEASNPSNPTEDQRRIRAALDTIEGAMKSDDVSFSELIDVLLSVEDILSGRSIV